jgi:hypothetical protein
LSPEPAQRVPAAFRRVQTGTSELVGIRRAWPPQVCQARLSQLPGEPVGPARTGSTSAWCFSSPLQALSERPQLIAHRALGTVKFITSGLHILKTATARHDSQPLRRTARVMRGCDTQAQCPARDSRQPQQTQALHGSLRTKDKNDAPRHCRVAPAVSVLQSTRADRRSAWRKRLCGHRQLRPRLGRRQHPRPPRLALSGDWDRLPVAAGYPPPPCGHEGSRRAPSNWQQLRSTLALRICDIARGSTTAEAIGTDGTRDRVAAAPLLPAHPCQPTSFICQVHRPGSSARFIGKISHRQSH